MNYGEYWIRKAKSILAMVGGTISLCIGGLITAFTPIGWLFVIAGLAGIGWGIYKFNELRFDRENSGTRIYHSGGRY